MLEVIPESPFADAVGVALQFPSPPIPRPGFVAATSPLMQSRNLGAFGAAPASVVRTATSAATPTAVPPIVRLFDTSPPLVAGASLSRGGARPGDELLDLSAFDRGPPCPGAPVAEAPDVPD